MPFGLFPRPTRVAALALAMAAASLAPGPAEAAAQGAASDPEAVALVKAFEAKLNLQGLDVTDTFTLVQKKEGDSDRVIRVRVYRRDAANTFTLIFEYPESEKGKGYWRSNDDLYLYLPSTREFVYRNRKDDIGDTDVRTDIFGKSSLLDQYRAAMAGSAKVASWDCYVLALDATKLDVSYPKQRLYLRKSDGLPVKAEEYSAGGTLLRTLYYVDYAQVVPGKYIYSKLLAVDALEKGRKTYLSNDAVSTTRIEDYVFSKAFLEEKSR
jgi:hypothetical protein